MPEFIETDSSLEIQDKMSILMRVILLLLALFPLLAPYQLLIQPEWHDYLNPVFFFSVLISIGALAVSGLFVWAAVAGMNKHMRFDKRQSTFTYMWDAPIVPIRKHEYPIRSIWSVDIETHDWSDGSPSYSLKIEMEDGREFTSGSSWSRKEIEGAKERVTLFLEQS